MSFNIFITKRITQYFLLFLLANVTSYVYATNFFSNLMPTELGIKILHYVVGNEKIENSKRNIAKLRLMCKTYRNFIDRADVFKNILIAMADSKKNIDSAKVIPDTTGWDITPALTTITIANHWKSMPATKAIKDWLQMEIDHKNLICQFQDAAKKGNMEVLNNLLPQIKSTVGINATDALGNTTLFLAAIHNQLKVIPWLISHGADCNKPNKYNDTPLDYFVSQGKHDIVRTLLNYANPNTFGRFARPPLSTAIIYNNVEMVNLLIAAQANPNIKSDTGKTPLMEAIAQYNLESVKILVNNGASLSIKNNQNETALELAKKYKLTHCSIKDFLMNHLNSVPISKSK